MDTTTTEVYQTLSKSIILSLELRTYGDYYYFYHHQTNTSGDLFKTNINRERIKIAQQLNLI